MSDRDIDEKVAFERGTQDYWKGGGWRSPHPNECPYEDETLKKAWRDGWDDADMWAWIGAAYG